jgi:hypothetical protein
MGDHLEDLGLYGRITLKLIFRLIQIIHTTPGQQSEKHSTLKSIMNYSLSSEYWSKKVTNDSNVLIHSTITVLSLVPLTLRGELPITSNVVQLGYAHPKKRGGGGEEGEGEE